MDRSSHTWWERFHDTATAMLGTAVRFFLPGNTSERHSSDLTAKPDDRIVKIILHPAGNRRVEIVQRPDGLFTYGEDELVQHYDNDMAQRLQDFGTVWVPVGHRSSICDSQEAAEREARGTIPWLATV